MLNKILGLNSWPISLQDDQYIIYDISSFKSQYIHHLKKIKQQNTTPEQYCY